jgi:hypothetical protein
MLPTVFSTAFWVATRETRSPTMGTGVSVAGFTEMKTAGPDGSAWRKKPASSVPTDGLT